MALELLDSLSLPGNPQKPNEDAWGNSESAALVMDGATGLGDMLMPGPSDAAWLAQFGARRILAHLRGGDAPDDAVAHALADAEKSFLALRRRAPAEGFEMPYASMMLAVESGGGIDALWYGDCALLVKRPGAAVKIVGEALAKRAHEAQSVAQLASQNKLSPAAGVNRPQYLAALRTARNRINTDKGSWCFAPDARAARHASSAHVAAPEGTVLLLCSDGFLALAGDYGAYDAEGLIAAAQTKGLAKLGADIRAIEEDDFDGRKFPRFKKSDDATAVLLRVA